MHADHTIGDRRDGGIMRHDHHRRTILTTHILQNPQHLLPRVVIQRARRLIAQQDLRILGHRTRDRHTLLLATRQLRRKIIHTVSEPHVRQRLHRIHGIGHDLRGQFHVLPGRQIGDQIVELEHETDVRTPIGRQLLGRIVRDVPPVDDDPALGIGVHTAQNVEHRRLARTRSAQNDRQLTLLDAETHIIVRNDGRGTHLITLGTMHHLDIRHCHLHS